MSLSICRDPLGLTPVFFTAVNNNLTWSSSLRELTADLQVRPNLDYLLDYLCGAPLAPYETPFEEVYQLPAGSILTADPQSWSVKRHWKIGPRCELQDRTLALTQFEEAFLKSLQNCISSADPNGIAVRLSGGYDSSAVLGGLRELSIPLNAVTVIFDAEQSNESAYVDYLEKRLRARILRVNSRSVSVCEFDRPRWTISPFFDPYCMEMGELYRQALNCDWTTLFTGAFGDEFCYPLRPLEDCEAWLGGAMLRRRFGFDRPRGFLTPGMKDRFCHGLSRHWQLPGGFAPSCLNVFLGWGANVQTDALSDAAMVHGLTLSHPFLDWNLMLLSRNLSDVFKTADSQFKPILEMYLRKVGLNAIADRGAKATLGPYFARYYAAYALSVITSDRIVAAFEKHELCNADGLAGMAKGASPSGDSSDDILRLWQIGCFLAEEFP